MDQSMALIDAQVHFLEEPVVLVHIPLELYPYFLKSVLGLIFDETPPLEDNEINDEINDDASEDSAYKAPAFMNVSITPVEVSVMCPRRLVEKYFSPVMHELDQVDPSLRSRLVVSEKDYIAMQVLGEGLEAGKRVLELTSPLALAGISIFFISTYFSDYIIVPMQSKTSVIRALENRGFQFDTETSTFITNPLSPRLERSLSDLIPPGTPPPSTLAELQARTFASLRRHQITPSVDNTLRLVQCAAHHEYHTHESSMSILRDALTTVLLVDNPRFLSLTLAAMDPAASLLLEKRLLPRFARPSASHDGGSALLGSKEHYLIPITLDLRDLPLEASGIVCGVAGRLADAATVPLPSTGSGSRTYDSFDARLAALDVNEKGVPPPGTISHALQPTHGLRPDIGAVVDAVEISFLSTARAGTIIVGEDELVRAVEALEKEKVQSPLEGLGLGLELESQTPPDSPQHG
ncbi:uncharacterized protein N7515_000956 [Penicillium bovifimosum]|uniref:CASTOR ACT domain-containing protein n=1 Tax=Penicillium bovifimosum TaxID=126998 RepID=A0A9W9HGC4_9EURO|nr:uncharacterized protein N7515_000956 [Penicillium bovifimosum]KAJ5146392.1 hypothetical protein N7515_000956 [Penicillium bovifimosum]